MTNKIYANATVNGIKIKIVLEGYKNIEIFDDNVLIAIATYYKSTEQFYGEYITNHCETVSFMQTELYWKHIDALRAKDIVEILKHLKELGRWVVSTQPA